MRIKFCLIYDMPHEVENPYALAKRTSQIIEMGRCKYLIGKWY